MCRLRITFSILGTKSLFKNIAGSFVSDLKNFFNTSCKNYLIYKKFIDFYKIAQNCFLVIATLENIEKIL